MITMDPNTTHRRITLSADNTEMSTGETQPVIDNPGRFNVYLAALGSTGFSSGRHYWEVSVTGRLCYHLGMASESAQRRGAVRFMPATGYWTIIRDKQGQFRAVDGISVSLPVQTQVQTIGILLEYSKGRISFYDVSARSLMYSFVDQRFTDKIYPFINFCVEDDKSLALVQLLTPKSVDWIK
ncbi:zinc-binding protein A33-like [Tautogolabrus adspersus]